MGILQGITAGASITGLRMCIAGQEKIGKTTLSCGAPGTLLVPMEIGYGGVQVAKVPLIQNYESMLQLVGEIMQLATTGQFPYKSLVFDSVTALERLLHDYVIRLDPSSKHGTNKSVTMTSAHGGYGKAYDMSNTIFEELLKQLDLLAVHVGVNIIFTGHVFSSRVSDPTVGEYDSWEILLHSPKNQKTYGKREIFTQWLDVIGFLYEPLYLIEDTKTGANRGITQNKGRVMAVSRTPAYLAGNRFGLIGELPIAAPPNNGWNSFAQALHTASGIDAYTR
jgi:hypothetical protein